MNKDIFEGKWKQIRGEAKVLWGKFTHNVLEQAAGKYDVLDGVLQEKYGFIRQQGSVDVDQQIAEYEANLMVKFKPVSDPDC